jgi:hypothetical protein
MLVTFEPVQNGCNQLIPAQDIPKCGRSAL